jgi:hypothetical protein
MGAKLVGSQAVLGLSLAVLFLPDFSAAQAPRDVEPPQAQRTRVFVRVGEPMERDARRVRVTGPTRVPIAGLRWSCEYARPIPMWPAREHPNTLPYPMYLHAVECSLGEHAFAFYLECPMYRSDLPRHVAAGRPAIEHTTLIERIRALEGRRFVSIECE